MDDVGQDPLDDMKEMEISKLEITKQNIVLLNSDLEKDLQRLDEANQDLLKEIQEKKETIQSLEREIALSLEEDKEKEDVDSIISEEEKALRDLELETVKLEKRNKMLTRNVVELQQKVRRALDFQGPLEEGSSLRNHKSSEPLNSLVRLEEEQPEKSISQACKNVALDKGSPKQMLAELQARVQKLTESCAEQEKELVKIESDCRPLCELCEDQAHYIKKYQEILRQMEKEKEVLLLEKEVFKAENNSSLVVKPGSILVETIRNNIEKTLIKKQKRAFWYRHFQCLFFMVMIFIKLLGYGFFYLRYINPDFLVDTLPMIMSRGTLWKLRDVLSPFLTLEVDEVLPH